MLRLAITALVILIASGGASTAQTVEEIEEGRAQLRANFRSLVVETIPLDPNRADAFMAVYDQFAAEYSATSDRLFEVIIRYADNYPDVSANLARDLFDASIGVEQDLLNIQQSYFGQFAEADSAQAALTLFQLLRQFKGELDAAMFSYIPLAAKPRE